MVGVHLREYTPSPGRAQHVRVDVRDPRQVDRLFADYNIDTVIHAAGIASVDYVEHHYPESLESNIEGTRNVATACRRVGCHLVYISTNGVFDGTAAPYRESDRVRPVNKYGEIKVECERIVRQMLDDATIVRPILMYGWNHPKGRPNPATWLLDRLSRGEPVHMVTDVCENPLYSLQCGEVLREVIVRKPGGMLHVAGADVVSRYEFAALVADVFGLDPSLIRPVESSFFPTIAVRPKNTSFVTERMEKEMGVVPLTVAAGLRLMKAARPIPARA
jgi:dTDP-4-dehydrorhamnose reductase